MKYESLIIASGSGSIGGCTYSRNRGGQYIRRRALPINPGSSFQNIVTAGLGNLVSRWISVLTDAQRSLWAAYANAISPSATGLNVYIASNNLRIQGGYAVIDDAPSIFSGCAMTPPGVTAPDESTQITSVSFTNTDEWAGAAGGYLFIFQSRPTNASVNYFKGPYRFVTAVPGAATPPTSPVEAAAPFPFVVGQRVHFQFRALASDGRISTISRTNAIAVA